MQKEVYFLTGLLIFNTFIIRCQDIPVDSWASEIIHPANASYSSSAQSIGHRFGIILSTTVFVALNSVDFCNKWIFKEKKEEPLLSIPSFIFYWSVI